MRGVVVNLLFWELLKILQVITRSEENKNIVDITLVKNWFYLSNRLIKVILLLLLTRKPTLRKWKIFYQVIKENLQEII